VLLFFPARGYVQSDFASVWPGANQGVSVTHGVRKTFCSPLPQVSVPKRSGGAPIPGATSAELVPVDSKSAFFFQVFTPCSTFFFRHFSFTEFQRPWRRRFFFIFNPAPGCVPLYLVSVPRPFQALLIASIPCPSFHSMGNTRSLPLPQNFSGEYGPAPFSTPGPSSQLAFLPLFYNVKVADMSLVDSNVPTRPPPWPSSPPPPSPLSPSLLSPPPRSLIPLP